jgi:ubiquinone/menaquinone biosynthesis C-methylase UbiE
MVGILSPVDRAVQEACRLVLQAEVYAAVTRRFLIEAGIREGMRVLDVGSGAGDVGLLVSELVGQAGTVTGVDCSAAMARIASERARLMGKTNVAFVYADIESVDLAGHFDAVVGRFILRELDDAPRTLRQLTRLLAPGGILAFQEKVHAIPVTSIPTVQVVEKVRRWMDEARARANMELALGAKLPRIYGKAGLPSPQLRLEAPVGYGPGWAGYAYYAETLRAMLPAIYLHEIATEKEVDIDRVEDNMRSEAVGLGATLILTPCIGAWAKRQRL